MTKKQAGGGRIPNDVQQAAFEKGLISENSGRNFGKAVPRTRDHRTASSRHIPQSPNGSKVAGGVGLALVALYQAWSSVCSTSGIVGSSIKQRPYSNRRNSMSFDFSSISAS